MSFRGGLRARLVRQSFCRMLYDSLDTLGWFDSGKQYQYPVTFTTEPIDLTGNVPLNTLSVSDDDLYQEDVELGSQLGEYRTMYFIDFFGESPALSLHMSRDINDILVGRYEDIGRIASVFDVYDYTQATPTVIFTCQIEDVVTMKSQESTKPFEKNWYSIRLFVVDTYGVDD